MSEVFIEKIMRKESLTDGQHLIVDHTLIGKSKEAKISLIL